MTMNANRRILIVDDDAAIRESYGKIITGSEDPLLSRGALLFGDGLGTERVSPLSHEIAAAKDGSMATLMVREAVARGMPFAAAFVDMKMPGMNGAETVRALWAIDPDMKVVMVTALSDISPDEIIRIVGRDDIFFLRKPFTAEEIRQFVRALCSQWAFDRRREAEKANLIKQLHHAQKMECIGRLAGGVAHDFNNMLTVIMAYTQVALMDLEPEDPNYDGFQEIQSAADRSADLTRQLLAFARKEIIAPKALVLNDSVAGMINMLHRLISEDVELLWRPGADQGLVKMDPSQLDQILANLCVNACDAIDGVGRITIETDTALVDPDDCARHAECVPGDYLLLTFSDDGRGMDGETLEKIFEPFFTTKAAGEGTGLGLATVYGIVKQNNGMINVYSEPGRGASFKIYLPRYTPDIHEGAENIGEPPTFRGHETILLVEDDPGVLKSVRMMLEHLGHRVLAVSSPNEALGVAENEAGRIDLLLTDVIMSDMNGWELAEILMSSHPNLRRLFMSGYAVESVPHHEMLKKDIDFIEKPFFIRELSTAVRKVMGRESPETGPGGSKCIQYEGIGENDHG